MPTEHSTSEDWFSAVTTCPLCQTRFPARQAHVVAERGAVQLLHLRCPRCGGATMALVGISAWGAVSVGSLTDLTVDEAIALQSKSNLPVAADDVLELHRLVDGAEFFRKLE